ncbi:hypothetical protein [Paraburkholderia caribensis]|uniref:hypothetical protein n=1 Tax=Paraburkholderia caribensis TaxID=75105 RepID=UPI0020919C61|nr:hypothetical protein [Paraburkholderia caribensis]MCO4879036.1 hypothetical protein [Paraburkholderia caribensis]
MYTIFRQGPTTGVSVGLADFERDFKNICREHMRDKRARAFAFIFYNMNSGPVRKALKADGFKVLNDASGKDVTVYYLHEGAEFQMNQFNRQFLRVLNIRDQASPPCMAFFRVNGESIEDVDIRTIEPSLLDPHIIVQQMERHIRDYVNDLNKEGDLTGITPVPLPALFRLMGMMSHARP